MKNKLLFIFLVLILVISVLALCGCELTLGGGSGEPEEEEKNPDGDEEVDPPKTEYVTVKLVEKIKGNDVTVATFEVEKGTAPDEDTVKNINGTYYHGYKYESWHYDTYFNNPDSRFDPERPLDEDITLYGKRGMLAGENIVWSFDSATNTLIFEGEGDMFDFLYNDEPLWLSYKTLAENIVFKGNITGIGNYAFYKFTSIGKVTLPETVEKIGSAVFYESSISEVNFPKTLKSIGNSAFFRCENLTELVFNQGLEYVGKSAFYECIGVVRITLTNEIAEFGASAFYMCTNLKTAFYLGTEEEYDQLIFRLDNFWVQQLANTYFISEDEPEEPGPYWYYDDNGDIAQWYYTVGYKSERDAKVPFVFDYVDAKLGVTERNIDFLNSIEYHGYKFVSFSCLDDRSLRYAVGLKLNRDIHLTGNRGNVCGDGLTWRISGTQLTISGNGRMWDFETSKDAPWYGRNIVTVVIGEGVTHIGANTFISMSSLISVDIPTNVKTIHTNAFSGCNNLLYIYYLGGVDGDIVGLDKLTNTVDAKVYYYNPDGSGEGYFWRNVKGGMELDEKRVAWSLEDGVLTVGGDAALVNYSLLSETPWYPDRDSVREVVILRNANRVGYNSFNGMSGVDRITVPPSVMKIAESAFTGTAYYDNPDNWYLGGLYVSEHLIRVREDYSDKLFVIRDGTISIAENAFAGCSGITELVVNKELLGVYAGALAPLSLESIYFSGNDLNSWEGIWKKGNNLESQELADVRIFCFSHYEPSEEGYYWNKEMNFDGTFNVVVWESALPKPRGGEVGDICFGYTLEDLFDSQKTIDTDSLLGVGTVILFWNHGSEESIAMLDVIKSAKVQFADDVNVLAVHTGDSPELARDLVGEGYNEESVAFLLDGTEEGGFYALLGGDGNYPLTLVLDAEGKITYKAYGVLSSEDLIDALGK